MPQRVEFHVRELDCADEVAVLRRELAGTPGVAELDFDIVNSRMGVSFQKELLSSEQIIARVAAVGMHAALWQRKANVEDSWWLRQGRAVLTGVSAGCLVVGGLLHTASGAPFAEVVRGLNISWPIRGMYAIAAACGAWYVIPRAWSAIRRFRPDMNLLMLLAITGALALGDWLEAGTVACLFSLALLLEQWSMARTRRAIRALLDLTPPVARIRAAESATLGEVFERPVEEVVIGSVALVRPNERIPLDGMLLAGRSHVNEAPITGESLPVLKEPGAELFAGTINGEGTLELRVTKRAEDTLVARMVGLVEQAHAGRAPTEQWIERFALYYTPAMFALALATAVLPPLLGASGSFAEWLYRGLVVLVIACPCALVIATPVSIVSALTAAARRGVLVKGGQFLEGLATLQVLAIDKTGTLTLGRPAVQKIVPFNGHTSAELLQRAAALESHSSHPLARAILRRAQADGLTVILATSFRELSGVGAEGEINGRKFWIGSHRLMHEKQAESPEIHAQAVAMEDAGHSVVAVGNDNHVCGLISLADEVRAQSANIVSVLRRSGIRRIVMLTGDNQPTAREVAKLTGVDDFRAELLPEEKVAAVTELRQMYGRVAMLGDGANDAPALAAADIGIAMGAGGTDAAIETADIALMSDDLQKLPWLIGHARRTLRVIWFNATFALSVKAAFVVLTWLGYASLWLAIAADTGATLLVVANALRLLSPGTSPSKAAFDAVD
jgi:Cd2+/Zn2+-exporting ATPase